MCINHGIAVCLVYLFLKQVQDMGFVLVFVVVLRAQI